MNTERAILAGGCFWGMQESDSQHDRRRSPRVSAIPAAM